ncbi:MAG: hydrolase [Clostridiales bacterium]|nr:hydrolase [Clostridiales bacterium]
MSGTHRKSTIYFTADLHFGHENAIRHSRRPFESIEEMDAALIQNWNETVSADDEVYILGDFTLKPAEIAHNYLSMLNGRKYYIRGNHDRFLKRIDMYGDHFEWVKDYHVLRHEGRMFVLFHYPIAEWDGYFRGSIHLHGHVHNGTPGPLGRLHVPHGSEKHFAVGELAYDIGVDAMGFRPVSIDEIIARADASMALFMRP